MKIKVSSLVNVLLGLALVVSIAANFTNAVDYNPWLDVTDDGYGGIDDIVSTAEHFGASGDPTKLCNITSYPTFAAETVFYNWIQGPGAIVDTATYDAKGAQYLHVLVYATGLGAGEQVEFRVMSNIYDLTHTSYLTLTCYSVMLTNTNPYCDVVLYIPSDNFSFQMLIGITTTCYISLSYYLSW